MRHNANPVALVHSPTGLLVRADAGEVFNPDGSPAVSFSRSDPYLRVIQRAGLKPCRTYYVHRLVWEVVHGPIPNGFHVDHLDGNPRNNAIGNLEMVTPRENHRRQAVRSIALNGYATHSAKLTPDEVQAIKDTVGRVPTRVWARCDLSVGCSSGASLEDGGYQANPAPRSPG